MAVNPSPWGPKPQFELTDGLPAVGYKLFAYVAGSVNTKQDTFTDSTGGVANTNPLVLNSMGIPTTEWWWTAGLAYKIVLAPANDTDPPTSPVWTIDNLRGQNDTTGSQDQWVVFVGTPTFVSSTSFTLVGDQTSTFHPGRRLKTTNSGGTVYSTIISSVFGAVTTVTVVNDSGLLDVGLSSASYGLISAVNPSINSVMVDRKGASVASAATTNIWVTIGNYIHVTGNTGPITSFGTALFAGQEVTVVWDSNPTVTHNGTSLQIPGGLNVQVAPGDRWSVRADTTANAIVTNITKANGTPVVGSPLRSYLAGCGLANNVADATNDIDVAVGVCVDSSNVIYINVASMTKRLDADWSAGTGNGMRYSGAAIANTTYGIWAASTATGTQDIYAYPNSTSPSPATVLAALQAEPSGSAYAYVRRIGLIVRESGALIGFSQEGDNFLRSSPVMDVNTSNPGTSAVTPTVSTPLGTVTEGIFNCYYENQATQGALYVSPLVVTDLAAAQNAAPLGNNGTSNSAVGIGADQLNIRTNNAAQIRYRSSVSNANTVVRIATIGWIDRRGRDA